MVYQSAKRAGKNAGLDGALDELGRRFVRKASTAQGPASEAQATPATKFDKP